MNETKDEFDCQGTDEIVCPYCGYEFTDSWDFGFNGMEIEIECHGEECGKKFKCAPSYSTTYYSTKIKQA